MTVAERPPTFKFIHVGIPHLPAVLDQDCRYTGPRKPTRAHYRAQATCALRRVADLLTKLRQLGRYDDTAIVIASDHGVMFPPTGFRGEPLYLANMSWLVSRALALLVVKPPGSQGPLAVSTAPTAISDIGATVLDLLDLPPAVPGTPVFDLDPATPRPRAFAAYHWRKDDWKDEYFGALHMLSIDGPVLDGASWTYHETVFPPERRLPARSIDFGAHTARHHLGLGWSSGARREGETSDWAVGPRATLHVSLPASQVSLSARVLVPTFNQGQRIAVELDGEPVAEWHPAIDTIDTLQATLPADADRPPISTLTFHFNKTKPSDDDTRPLAALFHRLDFE